VGVNLTGQKQKMRRRTFIHTVVGAAAAITLPMALPAASLCRSCGATTKVHLIDTTLPLRSRERERTTCFSCTPAAKIILRYRSEYTMRMSAAIGKVKIMCLHCGERFGYIHKVGTPLHERLCGTCVPEARDCRRWVAMAQGEKADILTSG
jgi:hypothetical protein